MDARQRSKADIVEAGGRLHVVLAQFMARLYADKELDTLFDKMTAQQELVLNTVYELHMQGLAIRAEAQQAEQEVKANPNDLAYVRAKARKIRALVSAHHKAIMAANTAGKLTLPKIPRFEDVYTEEKTKADFYKAELQRTLPKSKADDFCGIIDDVLRQRKEEEFGFLAKNRSSIAKMKNAMLDVEEEGNKIGLRIEAVVKRAEELKQAAKAEEMSESEAKAEYARLAAQRAKGEIKLDEAEQKAMQEFKLSVAAAVSTEMLTATLARLAPPPIPAKRPSTSGITAALQSGAVPVPGFVRQNTPPSPTSSDSDSDNEVVKGHTPPGMVKTAPHTPEHTPGNTPPGSPVKEVKKEEKAMRAGVVVHSVEVASVPVPGYGATAHTRFNGAGLAKQRAEAEVAAQRQREEEARKVAGGPRPGQPGSDGCCTVM